MYPFTSRLIKAVSLFTLIICASITWWVRQIPGNPQIPAVSFNIEVRSPKESLDPKIYSVPFCEVIKNTQLYDRKLIRMQAVFVNDVDRAYVASDRCPDEDGAVQAEAALEPNDKLIESGIADQIGPLLVTLFREGRPLEVRAEMLGRFYSGGRDGRGHQFAIITADNARPTVRRERR